MSLYFTCWRERADEGKREGEEGERQRKEEREPQRQMGDEHGLGPAIRISPPLLLLTTIVPLLPFASRSSYFPRSYCCLARVFLLPWLYDLAHYCISILFVASSPFCLSSSKYSGKIRPRPMVEKTDPRKDFALPSSFAGPCPGRATPASTAPGYLQRKARITRLNISQDPPNYRHKLLPRYYKCG
ncbi:uncharacterized protein [Triticum aestivum]|uniref:uncharacterized protein isoform X2 n=1 Tax=Triticum aestivum TaxID=4565 RepID=UPI001D011011|nr:uncharacterized protein LOC123111514 isoform X2 [Triticum aestivum]XP_044388257.1 uncharacterized protein LOC123111514 isoform X2 [Triticum aestivum]